jgi:murein DD-endopeptidase MepM/ murein hydrolase activator NlpD
LLAKLGTEVEARTDQLNVLDALFVRRLGEPKFMPNARSDRRRMVLVELRLADRSVQRFADFHEGIDFPAEVGTPVVAAASGKIIEAGTHPQYGKIVAIDHGNGLVSRYAHASEVYVNEGDLVCAARRWRRWARQGRSTGPHLHFEVRMNGVPQNPARFLRSAG